MDDDHEDLARLSYQELADRYDLALKTGSDFATTETGDLIFLNGDYQWGNIYHNALHRFVVSWRFNEPMLKTLFDFVSASKARKAAHGQAVNEIARRLAAARDPSVRVAIIEELHELNDEIGIDEFGPQAYAGTIMAVLVSMLRFEWTNLAKPNRWDTAGTRINNYSVGRIIEAAANNFRHCDEWMINVARPKCEQL